MVDRTYETFVDKVAQGRTMSFEQVDAIASGRIWSGSSAKAVGLVDELGGLQATIDSLAAHLSISSPRISYLPEKKGELEEFMEGMESKAGQELSLKQIQLLAQKEMTRYRGVQARLPFEISNW